MFNFPPTICFPCLISGIRSFSLADTLIQATTISSGAFILCLWRSENL